MKRPKPNTVYYHEIRLYLEKCGYKFTYHIASCYKITDPNGVEMHNSFNYMELAKLAEYLGYPYRWWNPWTW